MHRHTLFRSLRRRLRQAFDAAQRSLQRAPTSEEQSGYDAAFEAVAKRLPVLEEQVERNRRLVRAKLNEILAAPEGRRTVLIDNSPPSTLIALAHELMKASFEERFGNVRRSHELAEIAHRAARSLETTGYLSSCSAADLVGETLLHVGNARRLVSDLSGSEAALDQAQQCLEHGTGDRNLKADLLGFFGSLRLNQRSLGLAIDAFEKEIRIRRLLPDPTKLGSALINRGIVAAQLERFDVACRSLRKGVELVEDCRLYLVALLPLGTALARAGRGSDAWAVACRVESIAALLGITDLDPRISWSKGVACLALGDNSKSNLHLKEAQRLLAEQGRTLATAFAALDRVPSLVALGRTEELAQAVAAAYEVFRAGRLEERALAAFMILHRAVETGTVSVQLAAEVANFVARSRYDRTLRFEGESE